MPQSSLSSEMLVKIIDGSSISSFVLYFTTIRPISQEGDASPACLDGGGIFRVLAISYQ